MEILFDSLNSAVKRTKLTLRLIEKIVVLDRKKEGH